MRPVSLGNGPQPGGAFEIWVAAALHSIEQASSDTLKDDASSSGNAMATVHGAAADQIVYFTSETSTAFTALTAFGRTIIGAASAGAGGIVPSSRTITAGTGLTGGGDLSADRTLALDVPVTVAHGGTGGTDAATARSNLGAAGQTQTDFISGIISTATNKDYRIIEKIPYGATLTDFAGKMSSGTLTAALKINATAVTNGSLNVTSTQGHTVPSALNVLAAADALVLSISAVSSPVDFSWTIAFTRPLV